MSDHIAVSDRDNVRIVVMRRPDKKNALTQDMYRAMTAALKSASGDAGIRCILITGVPGAFSAGNDIGDFLGASGSGPNAAITFLHALARCETPIVASVAGLAVGIGTTLLFHCDHVVATPNSHFSTPFTQLGLVPEGGSSLLAPRQIGYHRAFSLLVMGRPLDAKAAHECGLINTIAEDADAEALKAALEIAALPPEAVKISRELLRRPPEETVKRIDEEAALFAGRMSSPEAINAFKAFLSRRK